MLFWPMDDNTGEWVQFTLLCDVLSEFLTHTRKQGEVAFFFYRMLDSWIVFGCNKKKVTQNMA